MISISQLNQFLASLINALLIVTPSCNLGITMRSLVNRQIGLNAILYYNHLSSSHLAILWTKSLVCTKPATVNYSALISAFKQVHAWFSKAPPAMHFRFVCRSSLFFLHLFSKQNTSWISTCRKKSRFYLARINVSKRVSSFLLRRRLFPFLRRRKSEACPRGVKSGVFMSPVYVCSYKHQR